DHHRGLDLRSGDHLDIHTFLAQGTEHGGCHTHMAAHADTDNADLGDVGIAHHFRGTQRRSDLFAQQLQSTLVITLAHGEAEVSLAVLRDVLNDHIDLDVGISHRSQDASSDAGGVRHAQHRDLGFTTVESDAGYDCLFHFFVFL